MLAIYFASHCPETGQFMWTVEKVRLGIEAELVGPPVVFSHPSVTRIRVGRTVYRHDGCHPALGSMLWDTVEFHSDRIAVVEQIVGHLMHNGWECVDGPAKFFEAWNDRGVILLGEVYSD
ncbi:MAG: hypothetical protein AAGF31_13585, partial [Planctomycetota bacterium]